jgi:TPR repeat protein
LRWRLRASPHGPPGSLALEAQEHGGPGLPRDEPRAAQLYAAASQRGCATAANNLARMLLDGRGGLAAGGGAGAGGAGAGAQELGGPQALARALLRRSAAAGNSSAWYNL